MDKSETMMQELKRLNEEFKGESKPLETVPEEISKEFSKDESPDAAEEEVTAAPVDNSADLEKEAKSMGWIPKEKYKGNPEDYVDAKTFMDRADFRTIEAKKLRMQVEQESQKNAELREMVKGLVDDIKSAKQKAIDDYLKELEVAKKQAEEANDLQVYKEIEKKELEYKQPEKPVQQPQTKSEDIVWFESVNPWVKDVFKDPKATAMWKDSEATLNEFNRVNPGKTDREQLEFVTNYVKTKYNLGGTEEETRAPKTSVPGISGRSPGNSKDKLIAPKDLTESQKFIYNGLAKDKSLGISCDEYLKLISKLRG